MSSNVGSEDSVEGVSLYEFDCGTPQWDPLQWLPAEAPTTGPADLNELESVGVDTADILRRYRLPVKTPQGELVDGREVGDDRVDLSKSSSKLACILCVQEKIVMMVTSEEDTFIHTRFFDFCEVRSFLPCDRQQSYDYARKVGDFSNLGFNDSVVLRIIMDVQKGDRSHSSTEVGKMTLFGSRVSTPRAEHRPTWMLAGWLQDGMLNTSRAPDPKYLPGIMGGSGVVALYDNPVNLLLSVKAYRGGKYDRIYGTCAAELESCLRNLERGVQDAPVLSLRMRDKQEYLHGTWAESVFIPGDELRASTSERIPPPLYKATGGQNRFQAFENRLLRTRHIVTRSQAEREWNHSTRLRRVLLTHWNSVRAADEELKFEASESRRAFEGALQANSALSNLLRRNATEEDFKSLLSDEAYVRITTGRRTFDILQAQWLCAGAKSDVYCIEDLSVSEDIFVRTEVSVEESFKVGGLLLRPMIGRTEVPTVTRTRVGLYQINTTMEEWSSRLTDKLINRRAVHGGPVPPDSLLEIFAEDPEWVSDDSLIIGRALRDSQMTSLRMTSAILVSNDHRLGNQLANTANIYIYRVTPLDYIQKCVAAGKSFQQENLEVMIPFLKKSFRRSDLPSKLYLDTGSLASAAARLQMDDRNEHLVKRRLIKAEVGADGHRRTTYTLSETNIPLKVHIVIHDPVHQPRRFRNISRPIMDTFRLSFNSDTGSWRANSESGASA
jgi:hypothetical protein